VSAPSSRDRALLLLVPMAIERAAVFGLDAHIVATGMGRRRALAAAERARQMSAAAVAVTGFCGALDDGLRPGDVVVATELGIDGSSERVACSSGPLIAALRARGLERVHTGRIVSSPRPVHGDERARLAADGAVAVDMESGWLSGAADGRPFAVLRVVLDTPATRARRPLAALRGGLRARRVLRRAAPALADWARAVGGRRVLLASPRSFCAGARRAIDTVERALELYGAPIYVRKQIVHNIHVVEDLQRRGAMFVDRLDDIPPGSVSIFSAHGVSPAVRGEAATRDLQVIDATCPLVTKVHREARRFAASGHRILLIGHPGHDEVEGTVGEAPDEIIVVAPTDRIDDLDVPSDGRLAYLTQTTLAIDEVEQVVERLRARFPQLVGPESQDVCYATTNRQRAVREVARDADLVVVIGSGNSSNSRRLVEIAEREGCRAALIDDETGLDPALLRDCETIAVTAGASAPQELVDRVVEALSQLGPVETEERSVGEEELHFGLPRGVDEDHGRAERTG